MRDTGTVQLKTVALALILMGMVALPLIRGFQTDFAPAAQVVDNVSHPVPHATAKPSRSNEHDNGKPDKPAKPSRSKEHDNGKPDKPDKPSKRQHGDDD